MIKVLVLREGRNVDFLADMVWMNLALDENIEMVSNVYPSFFFSKKYLDRSHGKGFTLYGKLDKKIIKSNPSDYDITYDEFDLIVYPSIRRYDKYFWVVLNRFGHDRVVAIDGEDDEIISWHSKYCNYFKRELSEIAFSRGVKPIQLFFPKIIVDDINAKVNSCITKKNILAPCDPRDRSTFIYKDEVAYFRQYKESLFGFTKVRGGWEALRHYEIIASGALPFFENFKMLPRYCLHNYPRDLQIKANDLYAKIIKEDLKYDDYKDYYDGLVLDFQHWLLEHGKIYGSLDLFDILFGNKPLKNKKNISVIDLFLINYYGYCQRFRPKRFNIFFKFNILLVTFKQAINATIVLPLPTSPCKSLNIL